MSFTKTELVIIILIASGLVSCHQSSLNTIVKDVDGNTYNTIEIGSQVWMDQDLKTTRFNDGIDIPEVKEYEAWSKLSNPAFCWYNNDSTTRKDYGALYNWFAVGTGKLCPEGWHIPSDDEWNVLHSYLRRLELTGGSLKESSDKFWRKPNEGATNETGFTALPAGYRSYNGTFNLQRAGIYWWSSTRSQWWQSTDSTTSISFQRNLYYKSEKLSRNVAEMNNGFCVRCIKDADMSAKE